MRISLFNRWPYTISLLLIYFSLPSIIYTFAFPLSFQTHLPSHNIKSILSRVKLPSSIDLKPVLKDRLNHLKNGDIKNVMKSKRRVKGRFLHITDFHPDPYYKPNTKSKNNCHSGKGKSGKFGFELTNCDSPELLINSTLNWINLNLKDKIDFIIWTGDNVRHDNNNKHDLNFKKIIKQNEIISLWMKDKLQQNDEQIIPIIPNIGNNDVFPHNFISNKPIKMMNALYNAWNPFIPKNQYNTFLKGGYFFKEIISNKLGIISLNTLQFFNKNSNLNFDSCDNNKFNNPSYKQFLWLGMVLKNLREKNMKVWIIGHIPPIEKYWYSKCLRKLSLWEYEYRDVIIGSVYGHMNIDHFIPRDVVKEYKSLIKEYGDEASPYDLNTYHGKHSYDRFIRDLKSASFGEEEEINQNKFDYYYDHDDDLPGFGLNPGYISNENFKELTNNNNNKHDINNDKNDINIFKKKRINGKITYLENLRKNVYSKIKRPNQHNRNHNEFKEFEDSSRYLVSHINPSIVPYYFPSMRLWQYNITGIEQETVITNDNNDDNNNDKTWDIIFKEFEDNYELEIKSIENILAKNKFNNDKSFPPKRKHNEMIINGPRFTKQTFTPIKYVQLFANLTRLNTLPDEEFGYEVEYTTNRSPYRMETLVTDEWVRLSRKMSLPFSASSINSEDMWTEFVNRAFVSSGFEY